MQLLIQLVVLIVESQDIEWLPFKVPSKSSL